jgi:hypothetical protein
VERHGAVGLSVDELAHERVRGVAHVLGRPVPDDAAFGDEVQVIDDLQRLVDVVGDDDRRDAERVVELTDELAHDAQRNRVEPRERLVVQDEHRIERDRTRQRHAPRHAARQLGGTKLCCAAQADRVQLHQDEVANERLVELGVLAHGKSHVLVHRHVGEQRAELEQHADAPAQRVQPFARELLYRLAVDEHAAGLLAQLARR